MELEVVGGKSGEAVPCGCPVGTVVEVYNLFFNTPVRRKFLRTTQTEFGHVAEAFTRIVLATPQVHFTLRHNDKQIFQLAAAEGPLERIARFFGRDMADAMIWVEGIDGDVKLRDMWPIPARAAATTGCSISFLTAGTSATARCSTPWARPIAGCF